MDVVDDISRAGAMDDVPRENILINIIRQIDPPTT
jgi:hypothetical protein